MKAEKFYIKGMDCADCARKFQARVRELPGVTRADVNFVAATITVWGKVDLAELQRLGDLEDYLITQEMPKVMREDPRKTKEFQVVVTAGSLLLVGLCCHWFLKGQLLANTLLLLALVVGGYRTFHQAFHNVRRFHLDISVLMTIAVIGSLCLGEFHEAAIVAWLFSLSKWLEKVTSGATRNSLAQLFEHIPDTALLVTPTGEKKVPATTVDVGMRVLVKAGEQIPVDGVVVAGSSQVNESAITGDGTLVAKTIGSQVMSGTINQTGILTIEAQKKAEDSAVAKIAALVEDAQSEESQQQNLINRFAAKFTPIVILLAVGIALVPPLFFHGDWQHWIYNSLAVLVVACPCALVITTPAVLMATLGNAARNGIIIKGGREMEKLATAKVVLLEKSGTLCRGGFGVAAALAATGREQELLPLAAAVARYSNQPVAAALYAAVPTPPLCREFQVIPGSGMEGIVYGNRIKVGKYNGDYLPLVRHTKADWEAKGMTVVAVLENGDLIGLIGLADLLRPETVEAISQLKELGITEQIMITGDEESSAAYMAKAAGLSGYYAGLSPEEKVQLVLKYKKAGAVLVAGDGITDPRSAFARGDGGTQAPRDVSAGGAAGIGSDAALAASDLTLTSDDLTRIPYAISLSRRAMKIIRENIMLAVGLKLIAFLLLFPGWLTLWVAIISDMGANVLVLLNSLRLRK